LTKQDRQRGRLSVDGSGVRVDKANAALSCFRQHLMRKSVEIGREGIYRVHHDSFGRAWVRALALEYDRRRARAPRLVTDFAELFTVNCVSEFRPERFHVKLVDA